MIEHNHRSTCNICGKRLTTGFNKGYIRSHLLNKKLKTNHLRHEHGYSIGQIIWWTIDCIYRRLKKGIKNIRRKLLC